MFKAIVVFVIYSRKMTIDILKKEFGFIKGSDKKCAMQKQC